MEKIGHPYRIHKKGLNYTEKSYNISPKLFDLKLMNASYFLGSVSITIF